MGKAAQFQQKVICASHSLVTKEQSEYSVTTMKLAAPVAVTSTQQTFGHSYQEMPVSKRGASHLIAQSVYLFAITTATFGWLWLLTSIGMKLFFS